MWSVDCVYSCRHRRTYSRKFLSSSPSSSFCIRSSSRCFSSMESRNRTSSSSRARNWLPGRETQHCKARGSGNPTCLVYYALPTLLVWLPSLREYHTKGPATGCLTLLAASFYAAVRRCTLIESRRLQLHTSAKLRPSNTSSVGSGGGS